MIQYRSLGRASPFQYLPRKQEGYDNAAGLAAAGAGCRKSRLPRALSSLFPGTAILSFSSENRRSEVDRAGAPLEKFTSKKEAPRFHQSWAFGERRIKKRPPERPKLRRFFRRSYPLVSCASLWY